MSFFNVNNINWNRLKLFYFVAKEGSIVGAAKMLNISQPALSRSIQILEHSFKKELFYRHPRGVLLTYSGTKIFQSTERIVKEMGSLQEIFNNSENKYEETLKIYLPPYLASSWIYKKLDNFLCAYPNLHLEISTNVLQENLKDMDIFIGKKLSDRQQLIEHSLHHLTMPIRLFASAGYLQYKGIPLALNDLDNHHLISYEDSTQLPYDSILWNWKRGKEIGQKRKPYLVVPNLEGLLSAAKEGLGIVELPKDMPGISEAQLIHVLPEAEEPLMEIFFSYFEQMSDSKWIIALRDYLKEQN
ncbi:MAG: LysR family transcriptional regulator [Alphaproteobacteria bacterium]|nr:LysR family transcriptional regulator [Alphaproteobacteria bacterium]